MLQLTLRLYIFARLNPAINDIINQGIKYSKGTITVAASQIIKTISVSLKDEETGRELGSLSKELYAEGVSGMDYDDDNWCGTLPHHIHYFDPIPNPWFEQIEKLNVQNENQHFGAILNIISETISNQKIASQLKEIGDKLIAQSH